MTRFVRRIWPSEADRQDPAIERGRYEDPSIVAFGPTCGGEAGRPVGRRPLPEFERVEYRSRIGGPSAQTTRFCIQKVPAAPGSD
jgi:hypothetical protein